MVGQEEGKDRKRGHNRPSRPLLYRFSWEPVDLEHGPDKTNGTTKKEGHVAVSRKKERSKTTRKGWRGERDMSFSIWVVEGGKGVRQVS